MKKVCAHRFDKTICKLMIIFYMKGTSFLHIFSVSNSAFSHRKRSYYPHFVCLSVTASSLQDLVQFMLVVKSTNGILHYFSFQFSKISFKYSKLSHFFKKNLNKSNGFKINPANKDGLTQYVFWKKVSWPGQTGISLNFLKRKNPGLDKNEIFAHIFRGKYNRKKPALTCVLAGFKFKISKFWIKAIIQYSTFKEATSTMKILNFILIFGVFWTANGIQYEFQPEFGCFFKQGFLKLFLNVILKF
jgi:hypothetical protein